MIAPKSRLGIGIVTMRLCRSGLVRAGCRCAFSTMLQPQEPLVSSSESKQHVLRQLERVRSMK